MIRLFRQIESGKQPRKSRWLAAWLTVIVSGWVLFSAHPAQARPQVDSLRDAPLQQVDPSACINPANPVVAENCQPGTDEWYIETIGDIEGYASTTSANLGETVDFYVNTSAPTFDLHIYRTGYYGGLGGRLIDSVTGLQGTAQPGCSHEFSTGLTSCGNWSISHSLTIPDDWVSGAYLAKIIRADNGGANFMLFTVRDDERQSDILYQQSVTTFQAYNYWGGYSVYTSGEWDICPTISGQTRAVKVSFDRPYLAPMTEFNMYFHSEHRMVEWLEQQGYDVTYSTNMDTHYSGVEGEPNRLLNHKIFLSVGHDEYWSQEMRDAITAARDAGVHIGVFSSNTAYWRVRFEPDPQTGKPDRVMVNYKTTQSGPPDPSGHHTGTFRDPEGANDPENALLGSMYFGDNLGIYFPIRVSAEQAQDSIYRNTGLQLLPEGSYTQIGRQLVGWEWDKSFDNGLSPAGLEVLATADTNGHLLLDAGRTYDTSFQPDLQMEVTRYIAPSGAIVFAASTNHWPLGLAKVEPNPVLQQITYNLLADMGVQPVTPVMTLVVDGSDTPSLPVPDKIFYPNEGTPPVISDIDIATDASTALVKWTTDTPADSHIWLGRIAGEVGLLAIGSRPIEYTREHEVPVHNLEPNTTYYYKIISSDEAGRTTITEEGSFQTARGSVSEQVRSIARPAAGSAVCWAKGNPPLAAGVVIGVPLLIVVGGWQLTRRRRSRPAR